jgi:type I restriction enzyme M protein
VDRKLWIYDLRTNKHFTLKTNPLKREDLDEFVRALQPGQPPRPQAHVEAEQTTRPEGPLARLRDYAELVARDKASLDIFWLRDDPLADSATTCRRRR